MIHLKIFTLLSKLASLLFMHFIEIETFLDLQRHDVQEPSERTAERTSLSATLSMAQSHMSTDQALGQSTVDCYCCSHGPLACFLLQLICHRRYSVKMGTLSSTDRGGSKTDVPSVPVLHTDTLANYAREALSSSSSKTILITALGTHCVSYASSVGIPAARPVFGLRLKIAQDPFNLITS